MGDLRRVRSKVLLRALALAGCIAVTGEHAHAASDANDRVFVQRFEPAVADDIDTPPQTVPGGFKSAVVSWNAVTPGGSWLKVSLRAHVAGSWTRWFVMGLWAADQKTGKRHSVAGQSDAYGKVDTDTLILNASADQYELQVRVEGASSGVEPSISLLAVATSLGVPSGARADAGKYAWGTDLHVPERTQRVPSSPDAVGGGGDSWCSPASVSMVMAFWAKEAGKPEWDIDVTHAAQGTFDPVYAGTGNWPFNVAFASEWGLAGYVRQYSQLSDLEQLIAQAIPVIASISVKPGELDGAPYRNSDGHLLVIRGFDANGDVIVNDPYGSLGQIRRVYKRAQFAHVWLDGSGGTVYLIAPPDTIWQITK